MHGHRPRGPSSDTLGLPSPTATGFPSDALYPQLSRRGHVSVRSRGRRQLLSQAGWEPGADGVLVHRPSGERFETEIMVNQTLLPR